MRIWAYALPRKPRRTRWGGHTAPTPTGMERGPTDVEDWPNLSKSLSFCPVGTQLVVR